MAAKRKARRAEQSAKPQGNAPLTSQGESAAKGGVQPVPDPFANVPTRSPERILQSNAAPPGPPIVVMGGGAATLDGYEKYFRTARPHSGQAFVLIPNVAQLYESLAEQIARHTTMPVMEAADGIVVEANHIYLVRPNSSITIDNGILRLTGPIDQAGPQALVDGTRDHECASDVADAGNTERNRAELAQQDRQLRLSREFKDLVQLQDCSTKRASSCDLKPFLAEVLKTAMAVTGADMGSIQLLDPGSGTLQIAITEGLESHLIECFNRFHNNEVVYRAAKLKHQRVIVENVTSRTVLAEKPASNSLLAAGVRALVSTPLVSRDGEIVGAITVYYRTPRKPRELELQFLDLLARQAVDWIERVESIAALHEREERLSAILNTAVDAIITIDERGIILSVNPATERLFGYTPAELVGQNVSILMPSPSREEHDGYLRRYLETGEARIIGIGREALALRKGGIVFPVDLSVSRVDHLNLFCGIVRDITRYKELEREVVEIASLEQRRIGEDLHDRLGQELTALNLLASNLVQNKGAFPIELRHFVEQMADLARRSQQELRSAIHGLACTSIDSDGLADALRELAGRTANSGLSVCTFSCPKPVSINDQLVATHLYLIAREAVHNSVKHSQATNIWITLEDTNHTLVLKVKDDGMGIPKAPAVTHGIGLRIMRNRASIISAKLSITPVEPNGTLVTCIWMGNRDAQKGK